MAARNYSPQFLGDPHISVIPIHEQFSSSDEDSSATAAADNPPVFFHITATLTTLSSDEDDDQDDTISSSSEDSSATFSTTISLPATALSEEPILAALSEVNFSSSAAAASFARQILFCARTAQLTCDRIKTLHIEAVLEAFVDELPPDDDDDDDDGVNMGFVPASKEAIEGLRKAAERVEKAETCTVCLEEVAAGTEATRLPCSHWYHMDCIVEWLEKNKLCPVCRFEMP